MNNNNQFAATRALKRIRIREFCCDGGGDDEGKKLEYPHACVFSADTQIGTKKAIWYFPMRTYIV